MGTNSYDGFNFTTAPPNLYDGFNSTAAPTRKPTAGGLSSMQIFYLVINCLIFVVGTVGNSLVIYVTGFRMKRTTNSVWFLNLALADFLFTAFLIFTIISQSHRNAWPFGEAMCRLNSFVMVLNMFASIFLLMAISIDRCLSTWVVVWAQNKRTPQKAQIICVLIWLAAVACSIPFAIHRAIVRQSGLPYCAYSKKLNTWHLTIFRFVLGFLIPFLVITASYVAISVRARRLQRGKKQKSLRTIVSIILAFFFCWMPFHVMQFLRSTIPFNIYYILASLSVNLAFLNSCLNPILYVFMCHEFQKKLKQSICLVLETAFAEDHLSFVSTRSMSWQLSRFSRKSDSGPSQENKGTTSSSVNTSNTENNTVIMEEREALYTGQGLNIKQPEKF